MLSRRGFLGAFSTSMAGAAVDLERLGWVKGERVWSIPRELAVGPRYLLGLITPAYFDSLRFHPVSFYFNAPQIELWPRPRVGETLAIRRPPKFRARIG